MIVQNLPCPACQETGHDKTGDHLMVFEDGNQMCNRARYHTTGLPLFIAADGENPVLDAKITGDIKYTTDQFFALQDEGKLDNPSMRALALQGMRQQSAYAVMTGEERAALELDWKYDMEYFEKLKIRNLVSRHIKGQYAKIYNVRTGLDTEGKVDRHFYPVYEHGNLTGSICRTLPKDFRFGRLGKTWGDTELFGMHTLKQVLDSGRRMDILVLVGGHCDALAAQQMLVESQAGSKWADTLFHVWSVNNGEKSIEEIIRNKEAINRFKKIILAFDGDDVGLEFTKDVGRLFRSKSLRLQFPEGFKDPNACLIHGRQQEFVDAFFNPVSVFGGGSLKSVSDLVDKAKATPTMGLSWPWPGMDWMTFGIRPYTMYVFGGGTGVGKTEITKELVYHLNDAHGEVVAVIYLEEQAEKTVRCFAGKAINKRLEDPPITDPEDPMFSPQRAYSEAQANAAIDALAEKNQLVIADTGGHKDIDTVMEMIEEIVLSGIKYIVLDNLTAIEMKQGAGNKVEAIDAAMKRFGTFKDEKPITLFLLSHLTRPKDPRIPHEKGGEVYITDFRGSGSISFWSNGMFGVERNTTGKVKDEDPPDPALQRLTTFRNVKSRDNGMAGGHTVFASMNPKTGRLLQHDATGETEPEDNLNDIKSGMVGQHSVGDLPNGTYYHADDLPDNIKLLNPPKEGGEF
jgi:twinkle protein